MQLAHGLYSAGVLVGALAVGLARQAGAGRGARAVSLPRCSWPRPSTSDTSGSSGAQARPAGRGSTALQSRIGLVRGAAFVIEGGMENWGAVFLERDLDAAPAMSALAPAAYGGAMMLGRFSGQWLESRLGDTVLLAGLDGRGAGWARRRRPGSQTHRPRSRRSSSAARGISIAAPVLFGAGGRLTSPEERGSALADGDDARLSRLPRRAADRRRHRRGSRAASELRCARGDRDRAHRRRAAAAPERTCPGTVPRTRPEQPFEAASSVPTRASARCLPGMSSADQGTDADDDRADPDRRRGRR